MVLLQTLKEVDSSFQLYSPDEPDKKIAKICSLDDMCDGGMVFIKNNKYQDRLIHKMNNGESLGKVGVVFQESFFKAEPSLLQGEILKQSRFYATVESVDRGLSLFSKLFFDENNRKTNDVVDGRELGTARVHPQSSMAENVFIGANVEIEQGVIIHSGCVILSNSRIGKNTTLYPNVVIYKNVRVGENCIIHANTTIGSDGFSYNFFKGKHHKVWHLGGVMIEEGVEIGSNTSIDQGTFSPTIIGEGTKIDNQVHIAHNCKLGKGVVICGQIGMAGSVIIGDYVVVAGAANFAPEVKVGNSAQIGGMAGVTSDVPEKAVYGGHPARPLKQWLKSSAYLRKISLKK